MLLDLALNLRRRVLSFWESRSRQGDSEALAFISREAQRGVGFDEAWRRGQEVFAGRRCGNGFYGKRPR